MFTASNKGQVVQLIGVVFLFLIIVVAALFQFTTLITGGNIVEQTINQRFNYEIGDTRRVTGLQTALDDKIWRSPEVPEDKYGQTTAYELSSLYFSTENEIKLHGDDYSRTEVESDLREYFGYKMDQTWLGQDANPVDYELVLGQGSEESIVINNKERHPEARWNSVTMPLALKNSTETGVLLRTRTKYSIFEVAGL